ncbi:helix-turn-helix transcriptional regulator [Streptomyces sp. NPDC004539]|uniref:helix-turn-helix domain-containing protein n=1 Tax=Streptomyces sp. NPDC004539 TaxID=3154280 RepID=UPI0033ABBA85
MTDFSAIDALLSGIRPRTELPPAEERRALRETLGLSRAQVAEALGVSPSTVRGWESTREPTGDLRERYAYFLDAARHRLHTPPTDENSTPPAEPPAATRTSAAQPPVPDDDIPPAPPTVPRPCVLCGGPAHDEVEGYPQHLDPAACTRPAPTTPAEPPTLTPHAPTPVPAAPPPTADVPTAPADGTPSPRPASRSAPRAASSRDNPGTLITHAVTESLETHAGDLTAAIADLRRRAIPDAMALLDACRVGARYDVVGHPPLPDILRKKTAHGADNVWEARPHWTRPTTPVTTGEVTALDINGAYLSALKTHLPLGALEHSTGDVHSRRRSGIHLITPPHWDHHDHLPNPLGDREEPGPVWVTEPTLRLLQRLATDSHGPLCAPPVIHESFTSGATEQLFEKFRQTLRDAREKAITDNDETTLEYVKSMYSKFVSTMGESNYNREIYRPDWMHIIRSQAFVNLWLKAHKAHTAGLTVMRVMGTDELHLAGNWRQVFTEGRGVSEVKIKDTYTPRTGRR